MEELGSAVNFYTVCESSDTEAGLQKTPKLLLNSVHVSDAIYVTDMDRVNTLQRHVARGFSVYLWHVSLSLPPLSPSLFLSLLCLLNLIQAHHRSCKTER